VLTNARAVEIDVPGDRAGTLTPAIVRKRRRLAGMEGMLCGSVPTGRSLRSVPRCNENRSENETSLREKRCPHEGSVRGARLLAPSGSVNTFTKCQGIDMPVVTKLERLREVALDQHGFVTTAQALDEGVSQAELSTMVARGRIERAAHGVYQVPQVLETEYDSYQLAVLWTGAPEACLSHDTALEAWGITDINPDRIHVSVARSRRLRRAGEERYVIHYEDIAAQQVTWWQGIRIVTVPTAIVQGIASGVPTYLIRQALDRAGRTSILPGAKREKLTAELEARDGRA